MLRAQSKGGKNKMSKGTFYGHDVILFIPYEAKEQQFQFYLGYSCIWDYL